MITTIHGSVFCLRTPPESESEGEAMIDSVVESESEEQTVEHEEYLLCRQCLQVITSPSERIMVEGLHRHTFANPHGIVFEIGCFNSATGCSYAGPPSDEFAWFKGFSWQVAVCIQCLSHLGWLFTSTGHGNFHGLILDRLVAQKVSL